MYCPQCKARLPARFALAIRAVELSCPKCGVSVRATSESLLATSRAVVGRCTQAGILVGAVGVAIAIKTGFWWVVWVGIASGFLVSVGWSWRMALLHIEFERA